MVRIRSFPVGSGLFSGAMLVSRSVSHMQKDLHSNILVVLSSLSSMIQQDPWGEMSHLSFVGRF